MIALVTGATGCIGRALVYRLLAEKRYSEVRALVRAGRERELPEAVRAFVGTLADLPVGIGDGANVVFHLAGRVHDPNATPDDFHRDNVAGTGKLLDALDAERPPRFVFFSTVAVYGESTPREGIGEDAGPRPATPYASSKLAAEKLIGQWADAVGAVAPILRVATVYGPHDRGNMAKMMDAIARGRFVLLDGGRNRKCCVAVDNVAAAAIAVAQAGSAQVADRALIIADPAPYTVRELAEAMQAALGMPPGGRKNMPRALAMAVALGLGARAPITPEQVRRMASDNVYQATALLEISEYNPVKTLAEGMRDAAQWYRRSVE